LPSQLSWLPAVSHAAMDAEHAACEAAIAKLLALLGSCRTSSDVNPGPLEASFSHYAQVGAAISEVKAALSSHFSHEEKLMRDAGFGGQVSGGLWAGRGMGASTYRCQSRRGTH
jgi:hypothetical protein